MHLLIRKTLLTHHVDEAMFLMEILRSVFGFFSSLFLSLQIVTNVRRAVLLFFFQIGFAMPAGPGFGLGDVWRGKIDPSLISALGCPPYRCRFILRSTFLALLCLAV